MNDEMPQRQTSMTVCWQEAAMAARTDRSLVFCHRDLVSFPSVKFNPQLSLKILTQSVSHPLHFFTEWKFTENGL